MINIDLNAMKQKSPLKYDEVKEEKGFKILSPNKLLTGIPILLA